MKALLTFFFVAALATATSPTYGEPAPQSVPGLGSPGSCYIVYMVFNSGKLYWVQFIGDTFLEPVLYDGNMPDIPGCVQVCI